MVTRGQCLCGDIRFRVEGDLQGADACHCQACRRWSGHFWATAMVDQDELIIENGEESIAWYPENIAERGFCVICGSSMFFRRIDGSSNHVAVSLGTIEGETGLTLSKHIFVAEKGDYYTLPSDAEIFQGDDQ